MRLLDSFGRIVNELHAGTDRAKMGLPEHYVVPEHESLSEAVAAVYGASRDELARVVEDVDAPTATRLAAGLLVGALGDPRIRPLDPPLVDVDGGAVEIGTPPESVDAIVARYRHRGVKREWIVKECPRHAVELPPYRIGRYLVTNAEFAGFLHDAPCDEVPSSWTHGRFAPPLANHPVHTVSFEAARAYTAWLSRQTGRRFRLPSEAEWEYAAAGPDGLSFPCGELEKDCANTLETGLLMPTPVGCFPRGASRFGALDMAGNVEELTSDFYAPYPGGCAIEDDLSDRAPAYRICRGGAYTRFQDLARCQRRHGTVGTELFPVSFRVVEET